MKGRILTQAEVTDLESGLRDFFKQHGFWVTGVTTKMSPQEYSCDGVFRPKQSDEMNIQFFRMDSNDKDGKKMEETYSSYISRGIRLAADNPNIPTSIKMALANFADRIDNEMIALPVDADGKPWHMGDRFESKAGTETGTVGVITYEGGECRVNYAEPTDLKHYDSPTPASIADELDEAADDAYGSDDLVRLDPDTLREWAKALRSNDDRF